MGEMADFALEAVVDVWDGPLCRPQRTKTCRCCGETRLVWMAIQGRWVLGNGRTVHSCPVNPLPPREEAGS